MSLRVRWIVTALSLVSAELSLGGCATAPESEGADLESGRAPIASAQASSFRHPAGFALSDLQELFTHAEAPKPEELVGCDLEFAKLLEKMPALVEQVKTLQQWVHTDPQRFHWCFYGKLFRLEESLRSPDLFIDQKQKIVLQAYAFLTPLAKALLKERGDAHYLQWAIDRYRRLSETVFYRRVDLTPQAALQIESASHAQSSGVANAPSPAQSGIDRTPAAAADDPLSSLDETADGAASE